MYPRKTERQRERGANLAILAVVAAMIVAFMGISIYTGLQAYLTNELQKAATASAMAGAAVYYSGTGGPQGKPAPAPGVAVGVASNTFTIIKANSRALTGFGASLVSAPTANDNDDSITVNTKGSMGTPFLAPIGINNISLSASGTARALKYEPTKFIGPVSILPDNSGIQSFQRFVKLEFPLVDGPGNDMYVEQLAQQPYDIEACNATDCYDLAKGASPVGSSHNVTLSDGTKLMMGTYVIDLAKAGVNKASRLRITHGNVFTTMYAGQDKILQIYPTPLNIDRIMIFGYAGVCPQPGNCPIPAGFSAVE